MAGCGNHGCFIEKPKGQGTNGRCNCLRPLGKENEQVVKRKLTQFGFYKRRVEELEKSLVNLCRTIDRIEVTEGVDDLGQLAVGYDLTAQLLTARNDALGALWKGRVVE